MHVVPLVFGDQELFAVFDHELPGFMINEYRDSLFDKAVGDDFRNLRVFANQNARCHFHLRDLCAKTGEGLRQFRTDRAAAEDDQPLWQFTQRPYRIGSQVADLFDARNRRHKGSCTGGDNHAAGTQSLD